MDDRLCIGSGQWWHGRSDERSDASEAICKVRDGIVLDALYHSLELCAYRMVSSHCRVSRTKPFIPSSKPPSHDPLNPSTESPLTTPPSRPSTSHEGATCSM